MKRFLGSILFAFILCGCTKQVAVNQPSPAPNPDHSITATWQQSFANNSPCSATVTTSCISGFNEGFIQGTNTQVQLHTDTTAVCTGTTQPETCTSTFNGLLPIGSDNFYVATTYVDKNGAAGVAPIGLTSSSVTVGADSAMNVGITINN